MTHHVDVVQNDWHANLHVRVARADLLDEQWIKVEAFKGTGWEEKILQPFIDHGTDQSIDPEQSPKRFLEQLHTALSGTVVFATDLHDDSHCPFAASNEIAFRQISAAQPGRP